jgi:hypothetical protein
MTAGHGEKRTRKRETAIAALLSCPTVLEAAKIAGISESTLHRWMREPGFAAKYQQARENVLVAASEELKAGSLAAAQVLVEVAADKKLPSASRVAAARTILESSGLLKGLALSINNQMMMPSNAGDADKVIIDTLRSLIVQDQNFRETIQRLLLEVNDGKELLQ